MIKGVMGGQGITVSNSYNSFPYVPSNPSNPIQGMVRLHNQDLQVFDGSSWLTLGGAFPSVELSPEVQSVLNWARAKMVEESRVRELAKKHPTVQAALDAVAQAEQELKLIAELCTDHTI